MTQVFDRFGAPMLPASEFERRSWPEDFPHENGNYTCKCCQCGEEFIGHKRRVTCKACATDTTLHDLRRLAETGGYPDIPTIAMRCAADEIERLQAENHRLRSMISGARAALQMAVELVETNGA